MCKALVPMIKGYFQCVARLCHWPHWLIHQERERERETNNIQKYRALLRIIQDSFAGMWKDTGIGLIGVDTLQQHGSFTDI